MTMQELTQVQQLTYAMENLRKSQGKSFSLSIHWAQGGGALTISREDWESFTSDEKTNWIRLNLNNLWNEVQRKRL